MIKIQFLIGDRGTEITEPNPILKYRFEDYGIKITDKNPDILFVHSRIYPKVASISTPKVIIERADSAILYHNHIREAINKRDVLSVIKTTKLRDEKLHNSTVYSGRYHCKIINDIINFGVNEKQNFKIDPSNFSKIKCLIPTSVQDRFYSYKNIKIEKKIYDMMFVGNICYNHIKKPNVLNWHRKTLTEKLLKLKKRYKIFLYTETNGKQTLDPKIYQQVLSQSKICLSPWGMGEWNYRDFESMYTKTVLVKPNSNHVICYPVDIFNNNKMYIPCSPDFCDLEYILEMIILNYNKTKDMLEANRKILLDSWDINKLTYDFSSFIKNL